MDRGWVKLWRKTLDSEIWRMPPLYIKVWSWLLVSVDRSTGVLPSYSLSTIADKVSWSEENGRIVVPSKSYIFKILHWLEGQNALKITKNGQKTVLTIVNWDIYNNSNNIPVNGQKTVKKRLENGSHDMVVQEVQELEPKSMASPEAPPVPSRKASKAPVDPRVNSRPFLKRLEDAGLLISWARDGKLVGEILRARLASGVDDAQGELVTLWDRFLEIDSDPASGVFTMRGRAHDVPAFRQHLNLLLEGASGNGKAHHPQATCPDHGPGSMRREAWAGKLVLKCHACEFAYRTEALWTERPQEWEKTLGK